MKIESAQTLDAVLAAIPDVMFLMDGQGRYRDVYAKGKEHLLFAPPEAIIGKSAYDVFDAERAAFFTAAVMKVLATGDEVTIEYPLELQGNTLYFEARIVPVLRQHPEEQFVLVIIREVTTRHEQEQKALLVEKVFADATEGIMIESSGRYVIKVNPAMQKILELGEAELLGKHSHFFSRMLPPDTVEEIARGMDTVGFWHGECEVRLLSQKKKRVWLSISAVTDGEGVITNFLVMATDISEARKSRDQLEYMANHDMLTGLPNRGLLFDRLDHAVAALKRSEKTGALLFMDIDRFKDVNDNYGHHVGDQLLAEVARRLKEGVRAGDTVGRLGGDEFLMIVEEVRHIDEVLAIIQKIRDRFLIPFTMENVAIEVRFSIGVALIPEDGEDAETLVNAADRAMYTVKNGGRDGFEFYAKHLSVLSHEYFRIQCALRQALREEAFEVLYQPQFAIADGRLSGAEALLRCTYDELEAVPVEKLIAIAEESGMICEIGRFVFRSVCVQIAAWRAISVPPVRIAVNLSRRELGSRTLVRTVRESLEQCCVRPCDLEFEITESTLMQSSSDARENISALRGLGCRFSIDDFGTGYSSLSNLKEFNLDKLKIDRMFIDTLETDKDDQVIVSATISMAKKLGLTVLAEGVESAEQGELLKRFGCDEVQGFFYSRPISAKEMTEQLKAVQRDPGLSTVN